MDWMQLVAALANSLAWPATVVLIILLMRRPLISAASAIVEKIPLLQKFEARNFLATFQTKLDEVDIRLSRNGDSAYLYRNQIPTADSRFKEIAYIAPNLAVIEA